MDLRSNLEFKKDIEKYSIYDLEATKKEYENIVGVKSHTELNFVALLISFFAFTISAMKINIYFYYVIFTFAIYLSLVLAGIYNFINYINKYKNATKRLSYVYEQIDKK